MTESTDKGNKLEKAVRLIEEAILHSSDSFKNGAGTFSFESKKRITTENGVNYEIDLYVELAFISQEFCGLRVIVTAK